MIVPTAVDEQMNPAGASAHGVHSDAPIWAEYVPVGHNDADEAPDTTVPFASRTDAAYEPAGANAHSDAPAAEKDPSGHTVALDAPMVAPFSVSTVCFA